MNLKKRPVLLAAVLMSFVSLLSPLWIMPYIGSVEYYSIVAVLWRLEVNGPHSYIVIVDWYHLVTNVFILGMPSLIFAGVVTRFVAEKTSVRKAILVGIIDTTWIDIAILVTYLPYILSPSPYVYVPVLPIPVPIRLILGLAVMRHYQPYANDSIWPEASLVTPSEPKKDDWLRGESTGAGLLSNRTKDSWHRA